MQSKMLKLFAIAVLVVSLAFVATGCRKKSDSAKLGLKPGTASASTESSSASSGGSAAEDPKSPTSAPATSSSTGGSNTGGSAGGSGSSGSGSGGSGSSGSGSGGSGDSASKPKPANGLLVKVLWWNDTDTKAPNGCEIVYGSSGFKPSVGKDADSGSIGPVPFGKSAQLVIYPDGRGGKKVVVPFVVVTAMRANSDRDAIHVEISDTQVRVLGNAVDGFDKTFDRF